MGHSWKAASCTAPKTCKTCGETEGDVLPHTWAEATCTMAKTCSVCKATEGEALGHAWQDATYDAPMTCSVCAQTQGDVLKRTDFGKTNEEMEELLGPIVQELGFQLQFLDYNQYGWPAYGLLYPATGYYLDVEVYFEPTQDGTKVCSVLVATKNVDSEATRKILTVVAEQIVLGIEPNFDFQAFVQALQGPVVTMPDGGKICQADSCGIVFELQGYPDLWIFKVYPVPVE